MHETENREQQAKMDSLLKKYRKQTQKSHGYIKRASKVLMGGTTRTSVFFPPYPAYMVKGEGCRVFDVDGNCYTDFLNNYTSLIHGHCFAPVVEAIREQAGRGVCFNAPSEHEIRLAEILCERMDSVDKLRFTSSGTEAVMYTLRLARAYTGKNMIAKFEGGFNGTYDDVQISHHVTSQNCGPLAAPSRITNSQGLAPETDRRVLVLPFNHPEETGALIEKYAGQLACVIVEPVLGAGGVIPADKEFLQALRNKTEELGILLVFDEIMSFRLGYGGAQEVYKVKPDLTTFGKIISGGLPLAAFGGSEDIMSALDPRNGPAPVPHSGTFNGCAAATAAGAAAMENLTVEKISYLSDLGKDLRLGLEEVFRRNKVDAQLTGFGSLFNIHFTDQPITDHRGVLRTDRERLDRLFYALLLRGQFMANRGMICLSTAMDQKDITGFVAAAEDALNSGEV